MFMHNTARKKELDCVKTKRTQENKKGLEYELGYIDTFPYNDLQGND